METTKDMTKEKTEINLEELVAEIGLAMTNNRDILLVFKNLFTNHRQYEIVQKLQLLERKLYPKECMPPEEMTECEQFAGCLSMTGLKSPNLKSTYLVMQVFRAWDKMRGEYDLDTAATITVNADKYFGK